MRGRPLCGLTIAFAGGIALAQRFPSEPPQILFLTILAAFSLLLLAIGFSVASLRLFITPLIVFCLLGVFAELFARPSPTASKRLGPFLNKPDLLATARVVHPPDFYPDRIQLPLQLEEIITPAGRFPVSAGVLLSMRLDHDPQPGTYLVGDRFMCRLTLKPFHNFTNPGGYDYVARQAERGLHARAKLINDSIVRIEARQTGRLFRCFGGLLRRLDRFRQEALFWLNEKAAPDVASFYAALLLGYRHQLPQTWSEHMNRSGVTHLLAISGLHLGMVSIAVFWLANRLIRLLFPSLLQKTSDRRIALWIASFCALLYAFIGGLALPTWRAAIMLLLVCAALYNYRKPDPPSLLAAAALIILFISPSALRQVSFQLSFAALIGIILFLPHFQRAQARLLPLRRSERPLLYLFTKPFLDAFLLSSAVSVTVIPLVAYHFNGFSLSGFLANTLLVPWIGFLVLPIGLLTLLAFALNANLAAVLLKAGGWSVIYAQKAILWFSSLSWSLIWVGLLPLTYLIAFYAALALLLQSWRRLHKAGAFLVLSCALFAHAALETFTCDASKDSLLHLTAIDVGQGSSTLVRFPGGETMLIDGGGFFDDSFDVGRHVVAPFLWQAGIRKLDHVVLTHDHPDHRNGLRFILAHFNVQNFWQTGITCLEESGGIDDFQELARKRAASGSRLPDVLAPKDIGPCKIRALHPSLDYIEKRWDKTDCNNVSLVLEIEFGQTNAIIPGDIDASVEHLLFAEPRSGRSALLISPHHGSGRSNSGILFDRVHPEHIVFSCGPNNWFGFPAPEVLRECRNRRIKIHRTDVHGAITATSDGARWKIQHHSAE